MEGSHDCRCKSGLGRSLSDDHPVKTWMAGTGPAMTNSRVVHASPKHSSQRLQFTRQRVSPLRDIAGPETDDEVAAGGEALDDRSEFGRFLQRDHLAVTMRAQAEHEMIAIDAFD